MTIRSNARLAGLIFLLYIATGITSMIVSGRVSGTGDTDAKLACIAQHMALARLNIVLTLLQFVYPVILAVTLYALTRDEDRDLAMMAFCCRLAEAFVVAVAVVRELGVLSIATASQTASGADAAATIALGGLLMKMGGSTGLVAATCFALGSTLFSWLFLRARTIPVPLAWLGVVASLVLVVLLPAQLAGYAGSPVTSVMWLPMLVFELAFAFWLLIKGVALTAVRAVNA